MAKVIFHMGTHKTATTTLQDSFHRNHRMLAAHGVIYPAFARHTGHHGLLMDWIALEEAYRLPDGGIGTLRNLARRYVDSDQTLLLSSEEFSRAGGPGGQVDMTALRGIFEGYDEIEVIVCLRPQWQFLQSAYLQIARDRRPPSPPELVAEAITTGQVDGLWCDYTALYERLCDSFDPAQIRLLDFETARAHEGGIIGAMLEMIGCPLSCADLGQGAQTRSNVSPHPLPVWAGHAIWPQGVAAAGSAGVHLLEVLGRTFDLEYGAGRPGCIFTRSELARLNTHFGPRNADLAARVCGVQPGFALTSAPPATNMLYREDVNAALWVRAARRIFMEMAVPAGQTADTGAGTQSATQALP